MRDVVRGGVLVALLAPAGAVAQPADPPTTLHRGVTFEANIGIGLVYAKEGNSSSSSGAELGGPSLGIGGWLDEHHALTLRFSAVTFSPANGGVATVDFLGPSLQYWLDDHIWLGGGVGLGLMTNEQTVTGISLDLRAGYTISSASTHTFNLSVEVGPARYSIDRGNDVSSSTGYFTSFALLAGYQYL